MALPAPNLDDRRFQDLVDDAKRLIQRRCPEWTDHNVSDPGVTLIEAFAMMVDQLLYRLNRMPDRNYVKFLDLIGVKLFPANAATANVTFWLSAPQPATVEIPLGTRVAAPQRDGLDDVTFTTTESLNIVSCSLAHVRSAIAEGTTRDHGGALAAETKFACFDTAPGPKSGDVLLIGLSAAVPSCAVVLRFVCEIDGVGVDPTNPPLVWEAWDGEDWALCELDRDETGGINRAGDVVLHVPKSHRASVIARMRAGWIRARIVTPEPGQPFYSASPSIQRLEAFTVGGTVAAAHADVAYGETLGTSEGSPGQRFALARRPVVAAVDPIVIEVSASENDPATGDATSGEGVDGAGGDEAADRDGWVVWHAVDDFAASGPRDRHFCFDPVAGEVAFGPAVRYPDGTLRQHGSVPSTNTVVRLREYRTGGGSGGNVNPRSLTVLKSSIPYIASVENRRAATGGRDGEDIDNAKRRGPIVLRTRNRAVTAEDYELIATEAALDVARVRCVPAEAASGVRILVVPAATDDNGRLDFQQLVPAEATLSRIARALDERRVVGSRVVVEPPLYQGLTVVARVRARELADPVRLQTAAVAALYGYFNPISGGPEGRGWPFGRPIQVGEVYAVLQRLRGVELVEDARLFGADPVTGRRGEATQRLDLGPSELVFSFGHQVLVAD